MKNGIEACDEGRMGVGLVDWARPEAGGGPEEAFGGGSGWAEGPGRGLDRCLESWLWSFGARDRAGRPVSGLVEVAGGQGGLPPCPPQ